VSSDPSLQHNTTTSHTTAGASGLRRFAAAVVLTAGAWAISAYPLAVETLSAQAVQFLGFAWLAFQALSRIKIGGVSILSWAGILTPGGETREDYTSSHGDDARSGTGL